MKYGETVAAIFIRRPNRFIAYVELAGCVETVHVKNTGRCAELLLPGVRVVLEKAPEGTNRKTAYSLIAVYKGDMLINMDSQAPNRVALEAAAAGSFDQAAGGRLRYWRAEAAFGKSRFDLYWETEQGARAFMEVKGVTLEQDGVARFPDAPTERGTKHVLEMIGAVKAGYAGFLFFLIQMKGPRCFRPNEAMDPAFAQALRRAAGEGVRILAYDASVTPDSMLLGAPVEVVL